MHTLTLEKHHYLKDVIQVLLASFAICLAGQISIPLWFTPVPLVLQNALVLLVAAVLGPKKGSLAVLAFLLQGLMGMPVFANGDFGLHTLIGPRGGYLIGYLVAAFVTGTLFAKKEGFFKAIFALSVGNCIILALGMSYLSFFVGIKKAFVLGVLPFILGDLLKMIVSAKILDYRAKRS